MDYTVIPKRIIKERDEICVPLKVGEAAKLSEAKKSITYFCYHMLGIKPYAWQHMFFRQIENNDKDIIICTPRQVGKSFAVSVAALWMATFNISPIDSKGNRTIIGIVSKSNDQAMKLVSDIRTLMYQGDMIVEQRFGVPKRFTSMLSNKINDTNNRTHLTFRETKRVFEKGKRILVPEGKVISEIISIPATNSARGHTFSKLFGDEAAFFEDDDFFPTTAQPTLRKTKGHMVLTSTPNGQRGYFFKVFDPEDISVTNNWYRMWLHYNHIEDESERDAVLIKKADMDRTGHAKKFQQEYEAMFTADAISFFDADKVDEAVDSGLQKWDSYEKPTDMGIDFGFKTANTVITISRLGEDKISRLVYHKVYPAKEDLDIFDDVVNLVERFNVQRVIVDDCPAASFFMQQVDKYGKINLKKMSFKTDKARKYFQFRGKMYEGNIRFYKEPRLIAEMKAMEEEETQRSTRISKPIGGSDDFIDSFLMSLYYQIEDKAGVKIYDWDLI